MTRSCSYRVGNNHKKGMSDLHEDFDPDQREGWPSEETEILDHEWVKSNGYSVRGEYWDVESKSKDTMDRPEFMRMISDSERMGIRVLVFSDQSRLSRDIIV